MKYYYNSELPKRWYLNPWKTCKSLKKRLEIAHELLKVEKFVNSNLSKQLDIYYSQIEINKTKKK